MAASLYSSCRVSANSCGSCVRTYCLKCTHASTAACMGGVMPRSGPIRVCKQHRQHAHAWSLVDEWELKPKPSTVQVEHAHKLCGLAAPRQRHIQLPLLPTAAFVREVTGSEAYVSYPFKESGQVVLQLSGPAKATKGEQSPLSHPVNLPPPTSSTCR